jgi:hypothetical protein
VLLHRMPDVLLHSQTEVAGVACGQYVRSAVVLELLALCNYQVPKWCDCFLHYALSCS